jgi:4-hydroxy-3-methylbut-2-enyl diphosphate reductase
MALLTQSTQPPWKFEKLAGYLTTRAHELKIVNTVCPVTIRRQQDTTELAEAVDLVVVVGGRNSANTRELTRLVGIVGKPAVQVEHARDLEDAAVFEGHAVVGVTGGTSTPIEDLETVAARIYELAGVPETQAAATELAHEAVTAVAESAYRSTSLGPA